jgi:excisionase family DNA binding protein
MRENIPLYLGIKDAAILFSISRSTIYRALERGDLVSHKCGSRTLIETRVLENWIKGGIDE